MQKRIYAMKMTRSGILRQRLQPVAKKIAQSAIAEVDKIINHGHFSPFELQQAYRKIGNVMLESFEVPHPIGKGNG